MASDVTRVLFVEDDDDVRENFAFELRQAGLEVFEERLAESALHAMDRFAPDLLLLDVVMPPGQMSGLEMLACLRERSDWKALPVIVLSGFGGHLNSNIVTWLDVRVVLTKAEVTGTDVARWIEAVLMS